MRNLINKVANKTRKPYNYCYINNFRRGNMSYYWGASIMESFKWFSYIQFNKTDYSIFLYLIGSMNDDNEVKIKQSQISEDLFINKSNVSRSIERLKEWQFITKIKSGFMINPSFFYINKSKEYERRYLKQKFFKLVSNSSYFDDSLFLQYDEDERKYSSYCYENFDDIKVCVEHIEKRIEQLRDIRRTEKEERKKKIKTKNN